MGSIHDTAEMKQSMNMRPACNRVLREVFWVNDSSITRYEQDDGPHILDSEFAIDLKVRLKSGVCLSGQEKALSHKYHRYKTFTMEFYQNKYTKEPGEFFKIASQFYLTGYSDETGREFIEWHIFKVFDYMDWIRRRYTIDDLESWLKPACGSRAMFLPMEYKYIPDHICYASGSGPGRTIVHQSPSVFERKKPEDAPPGYLFWTWNIDSNCHQIAA